MSRIVLVAENLGDGWLYYRQADTPQQLHRVPDTICGVPISHNWAWLSRSKADHYRMGADVACIQLNIVS